MLNTIYVRLLQCKQGSKLTWTVAHPQTVLDYNIYGPCNSAFNILEVLNTIYVRLLQCKQGSKLTWTVAHPQTVLDYNIYGP